MAAGDQGRQTQGAAPDQLQLQLLAPASKEAGPSIFAQTSCWVKDHAEEFRGIQPALCDLLCEGARHCCKDTVRGGRLLVCSAHAVCFDCGGSMPDSLQLVTYKGAGMATG